MANRPKPATRPARLRVSTIEEIQHVADAYDMKFVDTAHAMVKAWDSKTESERKKLLNGATLPLEKNPMWTGSDPDTVFLMETLDGSFLGSMRYGPIVFMDAEMATDAMIKDKRCRPCSIKAVKINAMDDLNDLKVNIFKPYISSGNLPRGSTLLGDWKTPERVQRGKKTHPAEQEAQQGATVKETGDGEPEEV
jgi:hypothetical protein